MKLRMLRNVRERFSIKYRKGKVVIIDHRERKVEEFDTARDATSYLVYFFYGMDIHQEWVKRSRFRQNLNKYYQNIN